MSRAYLGVAAPYHPLGLPMTGMKDNPAVPRDLSAHPGLEEILVVRADRMDVVRRVYGDLTDDSLVGDTNRISSGGYPRPGRYPKLRCLRAVVGEEWQHRVYAERDLAVLEAARS